ncbi:MAG: FecR family protein [Bacteroidetes bacterium]|nr:FecR family protein [Bacteroidota bacterium]
MTERDAQSLLRRYLAGECTPSEKEWVESWFEDLGDEYPGEAAVDEPRIVHDRMLARIRAELGEDVRPRVRWLTRAAAIAAAVVVLAVGVWLLWPKTKETPGVVAMKIDIEASPGGDKAILTLGNGQRMVLDSAANGMLATQGASRVMKQNGQLDYQTETGKTKSTMTYNTLSTPRGGQYKLVLSDGTKVWLDALSSITFPASFAGNMRKVSIVGQAYFEVAHDVNVPFEVEVRGQVVRDIGTSFNINAYADEPSIKVTLATGAAAVGIPGHEIMLKRAGQQAEWRDGQLQATPDANLESVLAWKNGLFYLTSADIGTVMRQISRWYDVEVAFENGVPGGHITGVVPRNTMLSTVLQVLQTSGVHFTVEGRKIFVTP